MDSLKWVIYVLNFDVKAKHFKYPDKEIEVVECDPDLRSQDESRKDTIIYYFKFSYGDKGEIYVPVSNYIIGIGFSYKSTLFFPVFAGTIPRYIKGRDDLQDLFVSQERKFIDFLKHYTGTLSPWLRSEAIKRKIISP